MTVTVKKLGGSMAVVIPKALARELELEAGTSLEVSASNGTIVMRARPSRRSRRPIKKIVAQMNPAAYRRHNRSLAKDAPVGRETW